jgi:hypothetical protein
MSQVRLPSNGSSGSPGQKKEASEGIELVPTQSPQAETTGPLKLNEVNTYEKTGYAFSTKKKWWILSVVALCQTSMSEWPLLSESYQNFMALTTGRLQRGRLLERDRPPQRPLPPG